MHLKCFIYTIIVASPYRLHIHNIVKLFAETINKKYFDTVSLLCTLSSYIFNGDISITKIHFSFSAFATKLKVVFALLGSIVIFVYSEFFFA